MTKSCGIGENGGLAKRRASDGTGCFGGLQSAKPARRVRHCPPPSECEARPQGAASATKTRTAETARAKKVGRDR
ncbi:hypothetical protein [Neisseria lactamica]|uniref:hypothetical protein n=1 Tax=Neisseria lactamica TaxID=486 RepID=UPI0027E0FDC6|nr:hypothetical protein [Neisseria lactamica]